MSKLSWYWSKIQTLLAKMLTNLDIPVVNINNVETLTDLIGTTLSNFGCLYIEIDDPITNTAISDAFDYSKKFFKSSKIDKVWTLTA